MLEAFLLAVITIGISAQGIIKKFYNGRVSSKGVFIFSAVSVFSACLFFVCSGGFKFEFNPIIIPYALGFAACFGAASVAGFYAIVHGSLSLTSLVTSYSLIIPTFYGLIFNKEKVDAFFWIGFSLLCVSLFLINSRIGAKKPVSDSAEVEKNKGEEIKITFAWVIFALVAFVCNGLCSTIQPAAVKVFGAYVAEHPELAGVDYSNEFMIIALLVVTVIMLAMAFFTEREDIPVCAKRGWYWMVLCGVANGLVNLLVMVLSTRMSNSLMFPIISAGGIILTGIVCRFFYREKLTSGQYIALVLGVAAVVFMNL